MGRRHMNEHTDWTDPAQREAAIARKWAEAEDRCKALESEAARYRMTDADFDRLCSEHSFGAVARGEMDLLPRGLLKSLVDAAVALERERCAVVAETAMWRYTPASENFDRCVIQDDWGRAIARKIRSGA